MLTGIDISAWQPHDLSFDGQGFVIAKATEGLNRSNAFYGIFRDRARGAGLPFIAYHFGRPDLNDKTGADEAAVFKSTAGEDAVCLDLEAFPGREWEFWYSDLKGFTQSFRDALERRMLLYVNFSVYNRLKRDGFDFSTVDLWIACPDCTQAELPAGTVLWQYGYETVDGRDVDHNIDLGYFGGQPAPKPSAAPAVGPTPPEEDEVPSVVLYQGRGRKHQFNEHGGAPSPTDAEIKAVPWRHVHANGSLVAGTHATVEIRTKSHDGQQMQSDKKEVSPFTASVHFDVLDYAREPGSLVEIEVVDPSDPGADLVLTVTGTTT